MKLLQLSALVPAVLAAPKALEIFWVTPIGTASHTGKAGYTEREMIPRWRNRWVLGYWGNFMQDIRFKNLHWIQYGDKDADTCIAEVLVTNDWYAFAGEMRRVNETPELDMVTDNKHHAGWDAVAWAIRQQSEDADVRVVVWENYAWEPIEVEPFPPSLDLPSQCGANSTGGHVSIAQFNSAFKSRQDRVWVMNYDTSEYGINYQATVAEYIPRSKTYGCYWATAGDPDMKDEKHWATWASNTQMNAWLFFMTAALPEYPEDTPDFPKVDFEDPVEAQAFLDEYWPKFLEVYGKNGTKEWKNKWYLDDDHPDNRL